MTEWMDKGEVSWDLFLFLGYLRVNSGSFNWSKEQPNITLVMLWLLLCR